MPPLPPADGNQAAASGSKRPWTKPGIRTLRIVSTRVGDQMGNDEDEVLSAQSGVVDHPAVQRYARIS